MNPSERAEKTLRWSALLVLLLASVVASADDSKDKDKDKDKKSTPAPSPHPARSAPSKTETPRSEGAKTEHATPRSTGDSTEHARPPAQGAKVEHEAPPAAGKDTEHGTSHGTAAGTEHKSTEHGTAHSTETSTEHGRTPVHGAKVEHEAPPAAGKDTEHGTGHGTATGTEHKTTERGTAHPTPPTGTNSARGTATVHPAPSTATHEFKSASGQKVQANYRDGHVRSIQAPSMRIDHGLHGDRRIVTEHNGRRIVTVGPHMGYSQRSYYSRGNREYVQRTYFMGGHRYAYAYRTYSFGGVHYYGYAPAYYYQPAYYGWAYNPWASPVRYRWGWDAQPWYGYYGSYFAPYGVYSNASLWLTDYIIAENLRSAYDSQPNPGRLRAVDSPVADEEQLDPEVKQSIANEVRRQIAAEQTAAADPEVLSSDSDQAPPALDSHSKIFVVSSDLDTTMSTGEECALTPGDVLLRTNARAGDDNRVDVTVASSKKDDCFAGSTVSVDVVDLQEMHNHLRQLLDSGLKTLADNSGKNGLPAAPDISTRPGEVPPPAVDVSVDSDIQQQQSDADRMEREAPPQD
jgi:hypothetical protein